MHSGNGYEPTIVRPAVYGPCCACGKDDHTVVNLATINRQAPVLGTGWSCAACGLPPNGAMAAICNACIAHKQPIAYAILGPVGTHDRIALDAFPNVLFDHDLSKHPASVGGGHVD